MSKNTKVSDNERALLMESPEAERYELARSPGAAEGPVNAPDTPLDKRLFEAIRLKNIETVKQMLDAGANLDRINEPFRRSPLQEALTGDALEIFQLLLERGARIESDGKDLSETSVFEQAVDMGKIEFMQALLAAGANPSGNVATGYCPLRVAASRGQIDIAKVLIEAGADTETCDRNGLLTPLAYAIGRHHFRFARWIIDQGAKATATPRCREFGDLLTAAQSGQDQQLIHLVNESFPSDVLLEEIPDLFERRIACCAPEHLESYAGLGGCCTDFVQARRMRDQLIDEPVLPRRQHLGRIL